MSQSIASLALLVVAGVGLIAYLFGYSTGQQKGHSAGHDQGHAEGKKEGAVRAFAVGYDRGKREREAGEEEETKHDSADTSRPSIVMMLFLVVSTFVILQIIAILQQG